MEEREIQKLAPPRWVKEYKYPFTRNLAIGGLRHASPVVPLGPAVLPAFLRADGQRSSDPSFSPARAVLPLGGPVVPGRAVLPDQVPVPVPGGTSTGFS